MLHDDDDGGGQDDEDGAQIKFRRVERRDGEPRRAFDIRKIDDPRGEGDHIAEYDADQDGDDGEKASERDGCKDGNRKRCDGDKDNRGIGLVPRESRHARRRRHELQTDDRDDRAHRRGREDDVDPARSHRMHEETHEAEHSADDDEAAERGFVAVLREDEEHRREKCKARTEIRGDFPFAENQIEERADAVEEQHRRGVDVKENRDEHRRAEHREEMLQGQRNRFEERRALRRIDGFL